MRKIPVPWCGIWLEYSFWSGYMDFLVLSPFLIASVLWTVLTIVFFTLVWLPWEICTATILLFTCLSVLFLCTDPSSSVGRSQFLLRSLICLFCLRALWELIFFSPLSEIKLRLQLSFSCFLIFSGLGLVFVVLNTLGILCVHHLSSVPLGPCQSHLWCLLVWDKILTVVLPSHLGCEADRAQSLCHCLSGHRVFCPLSLQCGGQDHLPPPALAGLYSQGEEPCTQRIPHTH